MFPNVLTPTFTPEVSLSHIVIKEVDIHIHDDPPLLHCNTERSEIQKRGRGDPKSQALIGPTLSEDYLVNVRDVSSSK